MIGTAQIGGIAGNCIKTNTGDNGIIINCRTDGNIRSVFKAGGIVGGIAGTNRGSIINCYNTLFHVLPTKIAFFSFALPS